MKCWINSVLFFFFSQSELQSSSSCASEAAPSQQPQLVSEQWVSLTQQLHALCSVFTCKVSIPLTVTVDMINSLWLRLLQLFHFGSWDIWKVEKQRFSSRLCWDSCVCVCRAANEASEMTTEEKPVQHTQEPVTVRLLFNVFVVLKFIFLTELLFHYITFIYTTVLESFYFN